jgi:hypothetical protein
MRKRLTVLLALLFLTVSVGSGCTKQSSETWAEENGSYDSVLSTVYPYSRSVLGEVYGTTDTDHALAPTPIGKSAMEDNRPPLLDDKKK